MLGRERDATVYLRPPKHAYRCRLFLFVHHSHDYSIVHCFVPIIQVVMVFLRHRPNIMTHIAFLWRLYKLVSACQYVQHQHGPDSRIRMVIFCFSKAQLLHVIWSSSQARLGWRKHRLSDSKPTVCQRQKSSTCQLAADHHCMILSYAQHYIMFYHGPDMYMCHKLQLVTVLCIFHGSRSPPS